MGDESLPEAIIDALTEPQIERVQAANRAVVQGGEAALYRAYKQLAEEDERREREREKRSRGAKRRSRPFSITMALHE